MPAAFLAYVFLIEVAPSAEPIARPNILIAISDDQSYPHASAYGEPVVQTPAFDRVARSGVLFNNAFTPCPGCSPMRAAFLTGQHVWQIRHAGTHASSFPKELKTFTGELEKAGYRIGYTGKPWGPGNHRVSGWEQNPVGKSYSKLKTKSPPGISATDYAKNFEAFLDEQSSTAGPFCFWYGGHEPHRSFEKGAGKKAGLDPASVRVPKFLPDSDEIRADLTDYYAEINWFDLHLGRMLDSLQERGILENTLVIVTSDNGMAFPRAKANLYEYGIHMPLAIAWQAGPVSGGIQEDALVSLLDVTATVYAAADVAEPAGQPLSGRSLLPLLSQTTSAAEPNESRQAVFAGRERHSSSRFNSLGYPCRCVRTKEYLYIRNFKPERWPAGPGQKYSSAKFNQAGELVETTLGPAHGGYHDIDACPSLSWMIANREKPNVKPYFEAAVALRPAEELYSIGNDPACMVNLADSAEHAAELQLHRKILMDELHRTGDLRAIAPDQGDEWETYPRYSGLRWFPIPQWAKENPSSVPEQTWLDERRPRD
ncbi:MAG TPA: heparan N-sulfatase [Planctomycetaceae bacterium]|nr:heparan N-sulfatase [Planctomycetaceae bacterium]